MELKAVLPKFHKYIHFPTRGNYILDQVYTIILRHWHLNTWAYLIILFWKSSQSIDLSPAGQDQLLKLYKSGVMKPPQCFKAALSTQKGVEINTASRSGDMLAYSRACRDLRKGIREEKQRYKQRIEGHNNPRSMWRGFQTMMDYNGWIISAATCRTAMTEHSLTP